jgi:hypothetical protein
MIKIIGILGVFLLTSCSQFSQSKNPSWPTYLVKKVETDGTISEIAVHSEKCHKNWSVECRSIRENQSKIKHPKKIILVGDTGCRLKESKGGTVSYQNCDNLQEWPWPVVATEMAKENADLIVHLGDYHYREECNSSTPLCEKLKATVGYHWRAWEEDFFRPVAMASLSAPWLFVRGNHEDCKRAHEGFLTLMTGKNFNLKDGSGCKERLPVEFYEFENVTLINWDNSAMNDKGQWSDDFTQSIFNQLIEIKSKVYSHPEKNFILLAHKPLFAFVPLQEEYIVVNEQLLNIWNKIVMPNNLSIIASGHIHNFQLAKSAKLPLQIVSGHGATSLDPFTLTSTIDSTVAKLKSIPAAKEIGFDFFTTTTNAQHFGYVVMEEQKDASWKIIAKNVFDKNKVECTSGVSKLNCHKIIK